MIVYYAHSISEYNTIEEALAIDTLQRMFDIVINPNNPDTEKKYIDSGRDWKVFDELVVNSNVVAFHALPNGRITSGVWKEIQKAIEHNIPVIELPTLTPNRVMTKDETLQHLKEMGLR